MNECIFGPAVFYKQLKKSLVEYVRPMLVTHFKLKQRDTAKVVRALKSVLRSSYDSGNQQNFLVYQLVTTQKSIQLTYKISSVDNFIYTISANHVIVLRHYSCSDLKEP